MQYLWAVMQGNIFLAYRESDDPDFVLNGWGPNSGFTGLDIKGIENIPSYGDVYDPVTKTFSTPPPPEPVPLTPKEQIEILESKCTIRRLREAFLDPTWMLALEAEIQSWRDQIPPA